MARVNRLRQGRTLRKEVMIFVNHMIDNDFAQGPSLTHCSARKGAL